MGGTEALSSLYWGGLCRRPIVTLVSHDASDNFRSSPKIRHSLAPQYLSKPATSGLMHCTVIGEDALPFGFLMSERKTKDRRLANKRIMLSRPAKANTRPFLSAEASLERRRCYPVHGFCRSARIILDFDCGEIEVTEYWCSNADGITP